MFKNNPRVRNAMPELYFNVSCEPEGLLSANMKRNRTGGYSIFFNNQGKIQLGEFGVDELCVVEKVLEDVQTGQVGLRLLIPSSRVRKWYTKFEEDVILAAKKHPTMGFKDIDLYRIQEEFFHSDIDKRLLDIRLSKKCQFQVLDPDTNKPETVDAHVLEPGLSILPMVQFQGVWIHEKGFGIVARITDMLIVDDEDESDDGSSDDGSSDDGSSDDGSSDDGSSDDGVVDWHPESVAPESVVASMAPMKWD